MKIHCLNPRCELSSHPPCIKDPHGNVLPLGKDEYIMLVKLINSRCEIYDIEDPMSHQDRMDMLFRYRPLDIILEIEEAEYRRPKRQPPGGDFELYLIRLLLIGLVLCLIFRMILAIVGWLQFSLINPAEVQTGIADAVIFSRIRDIISLCQ